MQASSSQGGRDQAQLLVRDLDEATIARLKERARLNGRSLQGEVKALLEAAAPQFTAAEALAIAEKWRKHWGDRRFDDSTDLIREDRDR